MRSYSIRPEPGLALAGGSEEALPRLCGVRKDPVRPEPPRAARVDPAMKLLSPYSSWRERAMTVLQVLLLLSLPLAVHFIFWSEAGIDATGRSMTSDQYAAIHASAATPEPQAEAEGPSPGWVGLAE
jgi:hypothetical protein